MQIHATRVRPDEAKFSFAGELLSSKKRFLPSAVMAKSCTTYDSYCTRVPVSCSRPS